eukprot:1142488-Pelagomonas_calceolata.AAC.3
MSSGRQAHTASRVLRGESWERSQGRGRGNPREHGCSTPSEDRKCWEAGVPGRVRWVTPRVSSGRLGLGCKGRPVVKLPCIWQGGGGEVAVGLLWMVLPR